MFSLSDYGLANSHTFPRDEKKKKKKGETKGLGFRALSFPLSAALVAGMWAESRFLWR